MGGAMTLKEKAVAATLGVVVLYGAAVASWFVSQEDAWKKAVKAYDRAKKTYEAERKLIGERQKWNDAYEEEREKMPVFSEDANDIDTHWLSRMDALAQENHVAISQRQAGQQIEAGDVFEQPIDVKHWEASISSLVKFMHALESEKDAMFDVREISVKSSSHKGFLTGAFKLACAYMRGEKEEE